MDHLQPYVKLRDFRNILTDIRGPPYIVARYEMAIFSKCVYVDNFQKYIYYIFTKNGCGSSEYLLYLNGCFL